jgi:hypothetical protein
LVERTVATGWVLLGVSTGDEQTYERRAPSEPSRAASRRHEALVDVLLQPSGLEARTA